MPDIPKGLEALLGRKPQEDGERVVYLATSELESNPYQPRTNFPEETLRELSQSIKTSGMLQPVVATRRDDRYVIIVGERRVRAAQMAGIDKVPVVIRDTTDKDMLVLALLENLHRDDLNVVEEAGAYQRLSREFKISHSALAKLISKSRSHISNTIRLLNLPQLVRDFLAQGLVGVIHARSLLSLNNAKLQETIAKRIIREKLSVRQVDAIVKQLVSPRSHKRTGIRSSDPYKRLAAEMSEKLGRRVWIQAYGKAGKEKGRIILEFFSPNDFAELQKLLLKHLRAIR